MADANITDLEKANVTLAVLDADGNTIDGAVPTAPVSWVSSDESIATVTVADDTQSADIVSAAAGTATVTVTDAAGLATSVNVNVTASQTGPVATSLSAIVAAATPK